MKFLETLFDTINDKLLVLFEKLKAATPHFVYDAIDYIKHLPSTLKKKKELYAPKFRIMYLKAIGYSQHYVTFIRGSITSVFIYLRSEEFKKDKKTALVTKPINYIKANPIKVISTSSFIALFIVATYVIGLNTSKIITGTSSRKPASAEEAEVVDETIFEMKHHNFEIALAGGEGGGHGAGGGGHHEETLAADIKIKVQDPKQKELLEDMEEMIDDYLEALEIKTPSVPIPEEVKAKLEEEIKISLNEGLHSFAHVSPIVKVELDFHLHPRPEYYRMEERSYSLKNVDLQVFEEDLNRNHQVYIDFTLITTNRNIILYLKDNESKIRDRLSTNVEPILPRLPIEDEGKRIIKDKVRDEINEMLKKDNIEGKVIQVYLDFSISS